MDRSELSDLPGFTLGDSAELSRQLVGLVRSGKKTATCEALRAYEHQEVPLPVVGQHYVILNWDKTPAVIVETESVECVAFQDVQAEFALAEGENETLEEWRLDHAAYFERNGGFSPDMILVCERFHVIGEGLSTSHESKTFQKLTHSASGDV